MEKKRRNSNSSGLVQVRLRQSMEQSIASEEEVREGHIPSVREYRVFPEYGKGMITVCELGAIRLSLRKFFLDKDLLLEVDRTPDLIQLSFLMHGEAIFSPAGNAKDMVCEGQECYMARLNGFRGVVRISGKKMYNELNIKLPQSFLAGWSAEHAFLFGDFPGTALVSPITDESLMVINDILRRNWKEVPGKLFLEARVLELLALQMENYEKKATGRVRGMANSTIKKLYLVKQLANGDFDKNYSIKDLARMAGLNEYVLKKEFKRIFGRSLNAFATGCKMQKAKELLSSTQMPVYEISEKMGYKNATHFSAAFKKYFGITPKKFRNCL